MAIKGAMDAEAYGGTGFLGVFDDGLDVVHRKRSRAGRGSRNLQIRS